MILNPWYVLAHGFDGAYNSAWSPGARGFTGELISGSVLLYVLGALVVLGVLVVVLPTFLS